MTEITHAIDKCRALLAAHQMHLDVLIKALQPSNAYFQEEADPPLYGQPALDAIHQHLQTFHWTGREQSMDAPNKRDRFMALACSEPVLTLAHKLNATKMDFRKFHEAIRAGKSSEREATEVFREQILGALGQRLLDVEAVDRQIQVVEFNPAKIRWFYNMSAPTKKRTIANAIAQLEEWAQDASGPRWEQLQSEITTLEGLPADQPVSQRMREPIKSLKYRATGRNEQGIRCTASDYGKNPVLYLEGQSPDLIAPPEYTGETSQPGRGRPQIVSDTQVSPSLKKWFFYLEDIK